MPRKTNKDQKPHTNSFKELSLSQGEKEKLNAILKNKKYWQRAAMKADFCTKYNRIPAEVDSYVKSNGGSYNPPTTSNTSLPTVSEVPKKNNEPQRKLKGKGSNSPQIRIRNFCGAVRMEEGEIIIDL